MTPEILPIWKGAIKKGKRFKTTIRRAIKSLQEPISLAEIEEQCPGVSDDMIRYVMKVMKKEGFIIATSKGKGARWVRTSSAKG